MGEILPSNLKDIQNPLKTSPKFSPKQIKLFIFGLFAFLIITAVFTVGGIVHKESKQSNYSLGPIQKDGSQFKNDGQHLSNGHCKGTEKRKLTILPMKMEDFAMIIPYGLVVGDHVTPIDHQYFSPTIFNSPRDTYEVRAMADANLVEIQPRIKPEYTEYRMVFSMSCTLFYYYDLVTSLSPDIKKEYDKADGSFSRRVNIPVKAGQVIGKIGGQTLDFAVWDMDIVLSGFVVPEHYKGEFWKIHTADPLDYYTDELKKLALSKYIRVVPPVSGKIDYDIDGKLVGNWFVQNTNGYEGIRINNNPQGYSKTHLAIVPNHIDPSLYMISFGNFGGQFKQFATEKSALDPTKVGKENGLIKYGLFEFTYTKENGEQWNGMTLAKNIKASSVNTSKGCVLFQLQSARILKMEAFPNISCQSVASFSSKATLYER